MPIEMPEPVGGYFAAERVHDADALARCFVDDGTVRDEAHTVQGPAAIRQWNIDARNKYHHTVEPLEVREEAGNIIVTGRVSGDFPGSPVDLQHVFQLRGGKIASLEIR
jgi:ketosteroid isomerase-like protein